MLILFLVAQLCSSATFTCDPACVGCNTVTPVTAVSSSTITIPPNYAANLNCKYTFTSANFFSVSVGNPPSGAFGIEQGLDFLYVLDKGNSATKLWFSMTGASGVFTNRRSLTGNIEVNFISGAFSAGGSNTGAHISIAFSASSHVRPSGRCYLGEQCPTSSTLTLSIITASAVFNYPGMDLSSIINLPAATSVSITPVSGTFMLDGDRHQLIMYEGTGFSKPFAAFGSQLAYTVPEGSVFTRSSTTKPGLNAITLRYYVRPFVTTDPVNAGTVISPFAFSIAPSAIPGRDNYTLLSDNLPLSNITPVTALLFYRPHPEDPLFDIAYNSDSAAHYVVSTTVGQNSITTATINSVTCPCGPTVLSVDLNYVYFSLGDGIVFTDAVSTIIYNDTSSGVDNNLQSFQFIPPLHIDFFSSDRNQNNPFELTYWTTCDPCTESQSDTETLTKTESLSMSQTFGDPHFVGLAGQKFLVKGPAGFFYNLYSSPSIQITALWIVSEGVHNYIVNGEIGIRVKDDVIFISRWAHLRLNTKPLPHTDERIYLADGHSYIQRDSTGVAGETGPTIVTPEFIIKLIPRKYEIDIKNFTFLATSHENIHGLLGQTWNETLWPETYFSEELTNQVEVFDILDGDLSDYVVKDGLFGTDFKFNQFNSDLYGAPRALTPRISEFWNFPPQDFEAVFESFKQHDEDFQA